MGKIFVTTGAVFSDVDSTKLYLEEIKQAKLLNQEEEKAIAKRIKDGDRSAINKLVESNLRFVVQVAKQYQGMGVELEDLIGFGNLGLFEAAKRFEADRGIKFISFAVWYVRAEIQKSLNDMGRTVRIPSHKTMTEEYSTISTGMKIGDDEDSETYADRYLPAEKETPESALKDLKYDLSRALGLLKPKQKAAVEMFYGIGHEYPKPMEQIAIELSVSGERARQLVRQAELGLKNMSDIKLLEQYL